MPDTPLNPDAVRTRIDEFLEGAATCGRFDVMEGTDLLIDASKVLAVAQPEVNSVEELDALPLGTVILDGDPCVLQMVEKSSVVGSEWAIAKEEHLYTTGKITLPARVLYRPEVNS